MRPDADQEGFMVLHSGFVSIYADYVWNLTRMRFRVSGVGFRGLGCGIQDLGVECTYGYCRARSAHSRQSIPDSGLGSQTRVLEPFQVVPSSFGSGQGLGIGTSQFKNYFTEMCSGSENGS
jgi:hypothetical protein